MGFRFFASCAAALTVAAVTSCASDSHTVTAAVSTGSSPPEATGHRHAAAPSGHGPAAAGASRAGMPAACHDRDLGARFQAGGYGGGNDFGSIEIWNTGASPCLLAGAVIFSAVFGDGSADPNARPNQPLGPLAVTLPARMVRPREGADPSGYLWATLMGPERDDPTQPDGSCRRQDELTPSTLVLSIGRVTLSVRNLDPASNTRSNVAVYGCHGRVLLEDLTGPDSR